MLLSLHGVRMSTEELLVNSYETKEIVLVRLEAIGLQTISGFASAYDDTFPHALADIISRKEFKVCVDAINHTSTDYFPCLPCYACGYLCCVLTLGLSLLTKEPCTKDLHTNLSIVLKRINSREEFLYRGIVWRLRRSPRCSWIEICQLQFD